MGLREPPNDKKTNSLGGKERKISTARWKKFQENVMISKVLSKACSFPGMNILASVAWLKKQASVTKETILLPESTIEWRLAV